MSKTILDVLDELRASALDERDKGARFEKLVQAYLLNDPEWAAKFSNVWSWREWPGRDNRPDTGIDLVAENADGNGLTAFQCKFYAADRHVSKEDIDGFIAASARAEFTGRYVVDTARSWGQNAEETMRGVAQRISITTLDESTIDWAQFSWTTPEVVVTGDEKSLRPHQSAALEDVRAGFETHDRGKLIMACGTGKTFTSLRIAEELVGAGGTVLFLVPSIQLLSQSLREWTANATVPIRPFAVCSDVRVGRQRSDEDATLTIDLAEPATTDPDRLVARMAVTDELAAEKMTVVFATYQSIDVVAQAQEAGARKFDLVICDEAHRTTGVTLSGDDDSAFVRVHDADYLDADRRLYMTATPRVFGDEVRRKADENDAVLADMGDENTFGPEFHRLGFGQAVEADLLTDYKVLVLAVDEDYVAANFQRAMAESGEVKLDEAAKLIGCWNGLAKNFGDGHQHPPLMKTAVAFAQNIRSSKAATAAFPTLVDQALADLPEDRLPLEVFSQHVDGTMGIAERNTKLAWLKASTTDGSCRILTNAKCLSEGVDVPALDAVIFLSPRNSQVDVVQSVGRVMRKAPGKELGYIILPVVVPSGVAPEDSLQDNQRYKVVWQILQALRSHDDRFHALVNKLELNKARPSEKIDIISISNPSDEDLVARPEAAGDHVQTTIALPGDDFRDAMYAKIVNKVGERRYWETWASDVADIASTHITRIKGLIADPDSAEAREFDKFLDALRANLNEGIEADEAIEMLAQHLVTRPVFEALFEDYDFAAHNPVAQTMEVMLAVLDETTLDTENESLARFYDSVRRRVSGVDNAEGKQRILIELYDKFFSIAFSKTVDKLGIVYTPVEIVDFIIRSADEVLRSEFGQGLTDEGVHILDPFTGTGTFLVRLLQSGLIEPHDLARKFATELHGNEILLLAYYIAAVNIETTYQDIAGEPAPFPGLVLADTFQSWEPDDRVDRDMFPENSERLERQKQLPITVIVGNPPYSVGQGSANDDNSNEKYPALDREIRETYAAMGGKEARSLYDSYIRAIKWASLRIADRGVIAYVTNGGFLTSNTASGMRKSLVAEFSGIHVFNLRGKQRGAGEQSRREGGKVFGSGSRATVAITLFVKDPSHEGDATITYTDIGDYLTRGEKLAKIVGARSLAGLDDMEIMPNQHGDWLEQRDEKFTRGVPIGDKESLRGIFASFSLGLGTNRDAWVYNFGSERLLGSMGLAVSSYQTALAGNVHTDERKIKWTKSLQDALESGVEIRLDPGHIRQVAYRPFLPQRVYADSRWIHRAGQMFDYFPTPASSNFGFSVTGVSSNAEFGVLAATVLPDKHLLDSAQFFARWRYERVDSGSTLDYGDNDAVGGYRRVDNITDAALSTFRSAYPDEQVTKDDVFYYVYGLLHSEGYRRAYAANLKKVLPHVPLVRRYRDFVDAGRRLFTLHVGYESAQPYRLTGLENGPTGDPYDFYAVGSKRMRFGKPSADSKAAGERVDRSVIHYNSRITLSGIPDEAYRYMLGSRSAIEWIIDRYYVKTDKASGIVNDPNDWSREVGDPRYIIDLLARIVTVSLETVRIVDSLPELDIIEH